MSYLCDLLFVLSVIFSVIYHIMALKQSHLVFVHFLECLVLFLIDNVDEKSKQF